MTSVGDVLLITNIDSNQAGTSLKNEKFLEVLMPISDSVRIICSGEPSAFEEEMKVTQATDRIDSPDNLLEHALNHLYVQLFLAFLCFRYRSEYEKIVLFMGYPGPALAGRLLGKFVVRFHGGPSLRGDGLEEIALNQLPNMFCSRIIVPTEKCIDHFGIGRFEDKVEVGHFHIDDSFDVQTSIRDRPRKVGYIGHMTDHKGVDVLVDAVKIANQRSDEVIELELGGVGPLAEGLDLEDQFITHHGWIDHDKIPEFYNHWQAFVLLSDSEGLPTVLLESMACGTPVVATTVGGVPELVRHGDNGFLLDPDPDPADVADVLLQLLNTADLEEMHRSASRTIDDGHRLSDTRAKFRKLLSPT